jgi:hypothetical protein
MSERKHRLVHAWKRTEIDRGYQTCVARAIERGGFTPPGTKPEPMAPDKVLRKRTARRGWA